MCERRCAEKAVERLVHREYLCQHDSIVVADPFAHEPFKQVLRQIMAH